MCSCSTVLLSGTLPVGAARWVPRVAGGGTGWVPGGGGGYRVGTRGWWVQDGYQEGAVQGSQASLA